MCKKRRVRVICFLTMFVVSVQLMFSAADGVNKAEEAWKEKVPPALLEAMQAASDSEKITVHVWVRDIDTSSVEAAVETQTGLAKDALEQQIPLLESKSLETCSEEETQRILEEHKERTEPLREKERKAVDTYTTAKRSLMKEAYQRSNPRQLQKLDIQEEDVVFTSQYTPMNIVKLAPAEIAQVAQNPAVDLVDLYEELEWGDQSIGSVVKTIEADYTRDSLGYKGTGIRIGMLESYWPSKTDPVTTGKVTHVGTGGLDPTGGVHATRVAKTILNVVPDAHIYAVSWYKNNDPSGFYRQIETLVQQNVSIINISFGFFRYSNCTNWYSSRERWLDHIGTQHDISVVAAAGNTYGDSDYDGNIMEPGLAYNVVTVGGILDNGTNTNPSDDIVLPESASGNGGNAGCSKPDVMAPCNVFDDSGTSYAAPLVAGVIAQMQQCKPICKERPWLVKAVLTASCNRKVTAETMENGLTPREGAGVINARRAIEILTRGRYKYGYFSDASLTTTVPVLSANSLNIGCSWARNIGYLNGHESGNATNTPIINLDMYVYKAYNMAFQGRSTLSNSSAEMVYFKPTVGEYKVVLQRTVTTYTAPAYYGLAWY